MALHLRSKVLNLKISEKSFDAHGSFLPRLGNPEDTIFPKKNFLIPRKTEFFWIMVSSLKVEQWYDISCTFSSGEQFRTLVQSIFVV